MWCLTQILGKHLHILPIQLDSTNNYRFEIIANIYFAADVHEFCWGNKIKIV